MGVFNTIRFQCPRCDGVIEAQSKVDGGCADYSCREVPAIIAESIENEMVWCRACDRSYVVVRLASKTVRMGLV
jgi:hypothetical protein